MLRTILKIPGIAATGGAPPSSGIGAWVIETDFQVQ